MAKNLSAKEKRWSKCEGSVENEYKPHVQVVVEVRKKFRLMARNSEEEICEEWLSPFTKKEAY